MDNESTIPTPEPRIARFERLAFGMFIHWGLYSQMGEAEWVQFLKPVPLEEYVKLKDTFTAEDFDAPAIARLAKNTGMKYITLTTRHHEGFSLYDTRGLNEYDAPHSPAKRDLVREFVAACRAEDIVPFFYHTTLDWHWKGANTFTCSEGDFTEYLDYLHASIEVLCTKYGEIGGLWLDGNWSRPKSDWKLDRLYGMIRKNQPEALITNNTGPWQAGEIGHPAIDVVTFENTLAKPLDHRGHKKYVAAEMCQTMNSYWGIGRLALDYKSPASMIESLASCRKVGANYLLNIGPTGTGAVREADTANLHLIGEWTALYAKPVYDGRPVNVKCTGQDFVLEADGQWYYFAFELKVRGLGRGGALRNIKGMTRPIRKVSWLDNGETLNFTQDVENGFATIDLTGYPYGTQLVVRVAEIEF